MEFLSFVAYLKGAKRNFKQLRYDCDIQYRCVLFHQFGESYRYHCRIHGIRDEYETIAYDVHLYEQRLTRYRSA